MDAGYGGPVWHASTAPNGITLSAEFLRAAALDELAGVGDPELGEWHEWSGYAHHVRRRLTPAEAATVGPVRDIRGTYEATKRLAAVRRHLPAGWAQQIGEA